LGFRLKYSLNHLHTVCCIHFHIHHRVCMHLAGHLSYLISVSPMQFYRRVIWVRRLSYTKENRKYCSCVYLNFFASNVLVAWKRKIEITYESRKQCGLYTLFREKSFARSKFWNLTENAVHCKSEPYFEPKKHKTLFSLFSHFFFSGPNSRSEHQGDDRLDWFPSLYGCLHTICPVFGRSTDDLYYSRKFFCSPHFSSQLSPHPSRLLISVGLQ